MELGQTKSVIKKIIEDIPNLEGRVLEVIFREKILENPPMDFNLGGSVFKNRDQIEIDFLLVNERDNKIHAFEIKRGKVNNKFELNKLIYGVSRLNFKSVRLSNPQISGNILTLKDI